MYILKIIEMVKCKTVDELNNAISEAEPLMIKTLCECFEKCGCRVPRQRCGYAGDDGKYYYCIERV